MHERHYHPREYLRDTPYTWVGKMTGQINIYVVWIVKEWLKCSREVTVRHNTEK